jgi:hypothetical protein
MLLSAVLIGAIALCAGLGASPASAAKAKGKVTACVIKKGENKGLMRFAPKGKCKRGERKLTWNRKGKRGKQGARGETGPAGPAGNQAQTDQLEQAVAALCTQMSAVTSQLTAVQTALNGLGLSGVLGGVITIPSMPAALAPFGCPPV